MIQRLSADICAFPRWILATILHRTTEANAAWLLHWFQVAAASAKQGVHDISMAPISSSADALVVCSLMEAAGALGAVGLPFMRELLR